MIPLLFLLLLLIFSFPLRRVLPLSLSFFPPPALLLTRDPPIYCIFKSFSLALPSAELSSFVFSLSSPSWSPPYVQPHVMLPSRVGRSINQLIRVINSTVGRPIRTLICPDNTPLDPFSDFLRLDPPLFDAANRLVTSKAISLSRSLKQA